VPLHDIRRLFDLSADELILSTEISNRGGMRVNMDPIIWHTVINQVEVVWAQSGPTTLAPVQAPALSSHQAQAGCVEMDPTLTKYIKLHCYKTIQLEVVGTPSGEEAIRNEKCRQSQTNPYLFRKDPV
jgi:hypothetical protein